MSEDDRDGFRPATRTDPLSADVRLRGRTYAIPFDRVWTAACALADGGMPRWTLLLVDDEKGKIDAEATTLVLRLRDAVHVDVALDENGLTRVDVSVAPARGWLDLGRGRRMVSRFVRRLDAGVHAGAGEIIDPTRMPSWSA
ncbi:MAG: DUF1499 domain-containing protein [Gemmatimonadetes bacterium]|nr:DUF1499 domain-containing protein [Gemmatimonadota bacterium]